MAKSKKHEARERARAAKARVDARRAARDEEITEAQTAYFVALAERDEAREAQVRAEESMARAVAYLNDRLGVRVDEVAELCEMTQTDVRALKRRAPQPDQQKSVDHQDDSAPRADETVAPAPELVS